MECYRRIVNCDVYTPWCDVSEHLSRFSNTMRLSGYDKLQRYNTINGAIERYNCMMTDVKVGERETLYRSGNQIRKAKVEKCDWANTWFLKGVVKDKVSCPVTPRGILKKNLSFVINEEVYQTQVIRDGGKPVHCGVKVNDPLRPHGCIF